MSPPEDDAMDDLAFDREEAWVAHAALCAACERVAGGGDGRVTAVESDVTAVDTAESPPHRRPLRRIERDEPLDDEETALLREALVEYLGDAPVRDRAPGRALLGRIGTTVESRPDDR